MTADPIADLEPPEPVTHITRRLEDAGYDTWAVGGAIRDAVLGLEPGDWDLATRAEPGEVRRLFRRTVPIGIEHGTVGVLGKDGVLYEVTTFRRDVETFGRHAVVEFADTLEEDLSRRDFTCNALAWHPLRRELADPFGGVDDLRSRRLQTVGSPEERFAEDYLRVLRALRFAGHFGLRIEPATWDALVEATPHLPTLSAERVREELFKVLENTRKASTTLQLYADSGALAVLYPELEKLRGLVKAEDQTGKVAGAGDVWSETLAAVDRVPPSRPLLRMAVLLHAIGMPDARARDLRGGWRFTGHEVNGAREAEAVMRRLKASNRDTERVRRLVAHQPNLFSPESPGAGVRAWLRSVGPDLVNDLFRMRFALWCAAWENTPEKERARMRPFDLIQRWRMAHAILLEHPPLETADLAIGGAELMALGLEPGPIFGRVLNILLDRVIERPELNEREALLEIVRDAMAET